MTEATNILGLASSMLLCTSALASTAMGSASGTSGASSEHSVSVSAAVTKTEGGSNMPDGAMEGIPDTSSDDLRWGQRPWGPKQWGRMQWGQRPWGLKQ